MKCASHSDHGQSLQNFELIIGAYNMQICHFKHSVCANAQQICHPLRLAPIIFLNYIFSPIFCLSVQLLPEWPKVDNHNQPSVTTISKCQHWMWISVSAKLRYVNASQGVNVPFQSWQDQSKLCVLLCPVKLPCFNKLFWQCRKMNPASNISKKVSHKIYKL